MAQPRIAQVVSDELHADTGTDKDAALFMLPSKKPSRSAAEQKTSPHESLHSALASCNLQPENMGLHMLANGFLELADAAKASLQKMSQVDRLPHQALAVLSGDAVAYCK